MSNKNLLEKLRAATGDLHERLEQQNLARHIVDHSIDRETYKKLLLQNYQAYQHLEGPISAFLPELKGNKAARLKTDLEALKMDLPAPVSDLQEPLEINSLPQAFGAAYVVEGSALGGMVIAKHLPKCEQLQGLQPQQFFSGDKGCLTTWSYFKEELAKQDLSEAEEQELLEKAKETFLFFERVFNQEVLVTM